MSYTDINDTDAVPIHDVGVGSTFFTKIETLIKKVLGNRTIGGTASTDITTNNSTYRDWETDRKSTRLNSSHSAKSRMPSSA